VWLSLFRVYDDEEVVRVRGRGSRSRGLFLFVLPCRRREIEVPSFPPFPVPLPRSREMGPLGPKDASPFLFFKGRDEEKSSSSPLTRP